MKIKQLFSYQSMRNKFQTHVNLFIHTSHVIKIYKFSKNETLFFLCNQIKQKSLVLSRQSLALSSVSNSIVLKTKKSIQYQEKYTLARILYDTGKYLNHLMIIKSSNT